MEEPNALDQDLVTDNEEPVLTGTMLTMSDLPTVYGPHLKFVKSLGKGFHSRFKLMSDGFDTMVLKTYTTSQPQPGEFMAALENIPRHPNWVQICGIWLESQEIGANGSRVGYTMEYMPGGSLKNVIHGGLNETPIEYDIARVLSWTKQAASALNFLHESKIIHRDVHPEHMLLNGDFTILKMTGLDRSTGFEPMHETVLGCLLYLAPEVISAEPRVSHNEKCDIYSLAIAIWEMYHRRHPTRDEMTLLRLKELVQGGMRPEISTDCDIGISELIQSCWSSDPEQRPSMKQIHTMCVNMLKPKEKKKNYVLPPSTDRTCEPFDSKFQMEFEQVKPIGHGSFGVVFKAMHQLAQVFYAVKRIAVADSERAIEVALREVRAMAKLDHPGIIRFHDTWKETPPPGWQKKIDENLLKTIREDEELSSYQQNSVQSASGDSLSSSFAPPMPEQQSEGSWLDDSRKETTESGSNLLSGDDSCSKRDKTSSNGSSVVPITLEKRDHSETYNSSEIARALGTKMVLDSTTDGDGELFLSSTATSWVYIYIKMELCQEQTLHSWLTVHNRPEDRARAKMQSWFNQLCNALSYIHKQGLIHRDVKPENIFFTSENKLKIGDLGLVCEIKERDVSAEVQPVEINSKNGVNHTAGVGTPSYMSPEQLQNQPYTYKVDVFALGLILCELIIPFETMMERLLTLSALREGYGSEVLEDLIEKDREMVLWLTSLDPEARPSCDDILEHLHD